ncbi:LysR family transcriptional regulator [Cocleimonas flava]|uniref:LysR family transcriptional regulator n=1 Tax=Cocleimonas flava TaxID=634765 RepID=A0A4R1F6S6_9GAMM|nr:LysR family transcriptional regulator [Cocleimonas flava]TCJ88292.1 LysR family transcriptional regulator [Cocleimonas flava]
MNTRFLEAFVWVARLNSFRAAAEKLYVSQATISSRIATLENEFECSLFDREHNTIKLTSKGILLLDKAERMLQAEQALQKAMHDDEEIITRVRIGVIEAIVHTWLEVFLTELNKTYPKLEFELTAEPTSHLHALFSKGALDVIIQTDPVLDDTVINTELESLKMEWVCHGKNQFANRDISLEELADSQIITFTRGSQPHLSALSIFEKQGLRPSQVHCVTSLAAISKLVKKKQGIATLPLTAISNELDNGHLALVNYPEKPDPLRLIASWQKLSDNDLNKIIVDLAISASKSHSQNQFPQ